MVNALKTSKYGRSEIIFHAYACRGRYGGDACSSESGDASSEPRVKLYGAFVSQLARTVHTAV